MIIGIRKNFWSYLFFLLIITLNYSNSSAQVKNYRLDHLSIEQGLSESSVNCIAQDSSGFLWFGTQDGLNRYDGYNFVVYRPVPDDSLSISDNYINCIYVDKSRTMWIGTNNELNKYNSTTDSFTIFKNNPSDTLSISSNIITTISGDKLGNLWIGTEKGLNFFNKSKSKFIRYFHNNKNKSSLLSNIINSVFIDSQSRVWIGTSKGLDLFNPQTKTFIHFVHNSNRKNSIGSNIITSISEDHLGNLWIGTYGGLDKFDTQSKTFTHFNHSVYNNRSISSDSIDVTYIDKEGFIWMGTANKGINYYNPALGTFKKLENSVVNSSEANSRQTQAFLEDREGLLWIGTFSSGIYKYDRMKKSFGLITIADKHKNNIQENDISAIYKDQLNNLWLGSFYAGIMKLNERTGEFTQYLHTSSLNSLIRNDINVIFGNQKDLIWIGTTDGLDKLNLKTNDFTHYKHKKNDINSLSSDYVSSITSDKLGNIWLGYIDGGMDKFNPVYNKFTHYKNNPGNSNSLSDEDINYLFFDNSKILWIGTDGNGLDRFNTKNGKFHHYVHSANNHNSLCNNVVMDIYQFPGDTSSTIWVATAGGGFSRLNTKTGNFKNYSEKDGLANNEVYGILGDNNGNLWISTDKGISKFNIAKQSFHNYDQSDGLQSNEYNQGAFFQSKKGKMYFGGKSGINAFSPDSVKNNLFNPQVVFTSFKDYNKPIKLKKSIWNTNQILLNYKDNIFSLTFSALSYTDPAKNKFAYMLKGLNNNWIDKGNNNEVTFTNLPPGKYTLLVKGTNNDGIWSSHIASINIIILPPFWQTLWFRIIIVVFLTALVYIFFQLRVRSVRLRNKKLEELVSDRTKELKEVNVNQKGLLEKLTKSEKELKNLNKHKDKIISVLAHDLKSPFNGLLGYTDLLANDIDQLNTEDIRKSAKNINNVANNLYKLLNNLLDWSLVQAHKIKYSPSEENLLQCVNDVIFLLKANAEQKSISLKTSIKNDINIWVDKDMLDIIFRNLLSNAIKFTKTGGEISIYSNKLNAKRDVNLEKTDNNFVEIGIQDNGIGMDEDVLSRILSPDSQITTKGTNNETGTGLGLSLCKELIEMQGGEMKIVSEAGKGTSVIFTLPRHTG
jgi:signal transduction histidine kinase/ligand-binding sensor domain-containing protein